MYEENKRADGQKGHHAAHLHVCLGATQGFVCFASVQDSFDSSTKRNGVASQVLRFRVRSQLSQSCCLFLLFVKSSRVYLFFLHATINFPPPSVTVSTHTFASNAVASQFPAMPNARISLYTQSVHSFSFPSCPLRNAPSRFPSIVRFVWQPPTPHSDGRPRPQKSFRA